MMGNVKNDQDRNSDPNDVSGSRVADQGDYADEDYAAEDYAAEDYADYEDYDDDNLAYEDVLGEDYSDLGYNDDYAYSEDYANSEDYALKQEVDDGQDYSNLQSDGALGEEYSQDYGDGIFMKL